MISCGGNSCSCFYVCDLVIFLVNNRLKKKKKKKKKEKKCVASSYDKCEFSDSRLVSIR